jgi:hypothetical protein
VGARAAQLTLVVGAGEEQQHVLEGAQLQVVTIDACAGDGADRARRDLTVMPRGADLR